MKKATLLLLVFVMLMASFVACGESENETTAVDTTATETEFDSYAGYDFGGKSLRIYSSADDDNATNANFLIAGSGETNGEIVNDAVYARNLKVEEGLNVHLAYTDCYWTYSDVVNGVNQLVMAGDSVYDVVINDMFCLTDVSIKGQLHNVLKTDKLSLDADWWYGAAMRDLEIVSGAEYLMLGDYFADSLASVHVLYYNRDVIENNYGDTDYLYDIIVDGHFTKDVMKEIMETCAVDLNGDGNYDTNDLVGYIAHGLWGPAIPLVTGFDVQYITRGDDGSIAIDFNNEHSVKVLEACNDLFYDKTAIHEFDYESIQDEIIRMMGNGKGVFASYLRLSDYGKMREYETTVCMSPYPKLEEAQTDYVSSLHDTSEVGAVLMTTSVEDLDFVFTCLDFLGKETAETVIPTWFDEALKVKYSSGAGEAVVIDMIRSSIDQPFPVAYMYSLSFMSTGFLNLIGVNSNNFASSYQARFSSMQKSLDKVIASYQTNLANGN